MVFLCTVPLLFVSGFFFRKSVTKLPTTLADIAHVVISLDLFDFYLDSVACVKGRLIPSWHLLPFTGME